MTCEPPRPSANLRGCDYSGRNLQGAVLRSSTLTDARFVGANLCGANLSSSQLRRADFSNANLTRANLRSSGCAGATFTGATFCRTIDCSGKLRNDSCPGVSDAHVCCSDESCDSGERCCGSRCLDTRSDANNCGSCGRVCGVGATCQAGACVGSCLTRGICCGTSPALCEALCCTGRSVGDGGCAANGFSCFVSELGGQCATDNDCTSNATGGCRGGVCCSARGGPCFDDTDCCTPGATCDPERGVCSA